MSDRQAAQLWAERLWGDRKGWAVACLGKGGRFTGTKYGFEAFVPRSGRWPADSERLLDELVAASDTDDVFVCPLLRSAPNRRRRDSHALVGTYAWMDADTWDEERNTQLLSANLPMVHQVASGGLDGGRHIYIGLDEALAPEEVLAYCKRLKLKFHTDDPGGDNKPLRLPGTWNHKARARGGRSGEVRWL